MSWSSYSKWDHIILPDDDEDTHPNVDTASLFRSRHQQRLEKMAQTANERKNVEVKLKNKQEKLTVTRKRLELEGGKGSILRNSSELKLTQIEEQESHWKKKEEELTMREWLEPWNIDTICREGKSRSVINVQKCKKKELTENEKAEKQRSFVNKYRYGIKRYGMFKKYHDSQKFLLDNDHLVCEETAKHLVIWCIDLEIEEKGELMEVVAHQIIALQFILELAKQSDRDPRNCVERFFVQMATADKNYIEAFCDELSGFKDRVKNKVKERINETMEEFEKEEKHNRLGPGGLDPLEVLETLPEMLKECFEKRDIELLQKVVKQLPYKEAIYHLKRCVDSGLWVPSADKPEPTETMPIQESCQDEYASINPDY